MKRKVTLSVLAILIATLIMTGYTYAYYKANVNSINQTQTVIKSNELGLVYTGITEITAENMIPGDAFTKTFSVENTSNVAVSYNIYMENITNEFNEDLVYTLSDENGVVIEETRLPETNNEKSYLKTNINIEAGATQNYTLKINYKYLSTPQNENQGATFNATVGIDTKQIQAELKVGGTLMATSYNSTDAFWSQRSNITKVVFEPTLSPKENAVYNYDVSESHDESVMSYLVANENNPSTYTLYLQTNGKIVANENSDYLFYNFTNLEEIEGLEYLDTSNVTNMTSMFASCRSLTTLNLSNFDTSNVTKMNYMFQSCNSLTGLNVSNFNTNNVTNMNGMFDSCKSLTTLNLSNFDTSKVTDMSNMFLGCKSLTTLDLSNFVTNNVTNMSYMFEDCEQLTSLNLTTLDTSKVVDMSSMFASCINISTLNLSNFDTSNVTNMSAMFYDCKSLTSLNVSNFNTEKVTSMYNMFSGCTNLLNLDIRNFKMGNTTMTFMYDRMPSSTVVKVKNEEEQQNILKLGSLDRPSSWTTENVVIAS